MGKREELGFLVWSVQRRAVRQGWARWQEALECRLVHRWRNQGTQRYDLFFLLFCLIHFWNCICQYLVNYQGKPVSWLTNGITFLRYFLPKYNILQRQKMLIKLGFGRLWTWCRSEVCFPLKCSRYLHLTKAPHPSFLASFAFSQCALVQHFMDAVILSASSPHL